MRLICLVIVCCCTAIQSCRKHRMCWKAKIFSLDLSAKKLFVLYLYIYFYIFCKLFFVIPEDYLSSMSNVHTYLYMNIIQIKIKNKQKKCTNELCSVHCVHIPSIMPTRILANLRHNRFFSY